MKVLQLAYKMPYPLKDGGALGIYNNSLCMLHQGMHVKLLAIDTPKDPVAISSIPAGFRSNTHFESVTIDTRIKPLSMFANLLQSQSYFLSRFYSEKFEQRLIELLREEEYDIVILEHLSLCQYLLAIRKHTEAKVILRSPNVEHQVWQTSTDNARNPFIKLYLWLNTVKLKKYETSVIRKLDGIMAVTPEDASIFKKYLSNSDAHLIAIPYAKDFSSVPETVFREPILYHLGSMDWLPNQQGIDWFIDQVLPLIAKEFSQLKFHIAGKKMPERYRHLNNPNLVVDGEVEDANVYQENKSILIVPLFSGGGVKVKIVEAMAMGKVVISTSMGAQGIPCKHDHDLLIANTPEEFITQIRRCMDLPDLIKRVGDQAQHTARAHHDLNRVAEQIHAFCKSVTEQDTLIDQYQSI